MPLAPVEEPYASDELYLLALCIWRESRGEPFNAKLGVGKSVMNRITAAPREGFKKSIKENILKPWAFSSFMDSDTQSRLYPGPADASWKESLRAASEAIMGNVDPSSGGVFYYSRPLTAPPPAWGEVGKHIEHSADVAGLHFYRLMA